MKILITGGVGFIGVNAALHFAKIGHEICVVDNFSRRGVEANAKFLKNSFPKVEIIRSDVANVKKYLPFLKKADLVLHLAAQTAVTTSITDPVTDFNYNLVASFILLDNLKKFNRNATIIYSSTNKVYGDLSDHRLILDKKTKKYIDDCHKSGIDENEQVAPISAYGCSKAAADFYCTDFARMYNMKTVAFRQSCIYGPFQIGAEDQGWVAHFTKQYLHRKPINIFGDGFQVRDLLYVDDLIEAYEAAIKKIDKIKGQTFNIGGGIKNAHSLLEVTDFLTTYLNTKVKISFKPTRLGDQKYFVSKNEKVKKYLNWYPRTDFKTGIKNLIAWQRKYL